MTSQLGRRGFSKDTTLVASSLCSDEVNRPLEDIFLKYYGNTFSMGGLAGFPFSGVTGFGVSCSVRFAVAHEYLQIIMSSVFGSPNAFIYF